MSHFGRWLWFGGTVVLVGLLAFLPACSSDSSPLPSASSPTGASSGGSLARRSSLSQESGNTNTSESTNTSGNMNANMNMNMNMNENMNENMNTNENGNTGGGLGDFSGPGSDSRFRGLVFGFSCDSTGCTINMKHGTALVPNDTEAVQIQRQFADDTEAPMTFDEFSLALSLGLPLRIRGTWNDAGVLEAYWVRIGNEIDVSGTINIGSDSLMPGATFTLTMGSMDSGFTLEFTVPATGLKKDPFLAGSLVRVEGLVPVNLGEPVMYMATEVQFDGAS